MTNIFDVAGAGMNAQMLRLNTTASNLANADSVSSSEAGAYRARQPVFATTLSDHSASATAAPASVEVKSVVESQAAVSKRFEPGNPMADSNGFVYGSNVDPVEEMANMISAARSYQSNVDVFNTSKTLMLHTLQLGQ